jgi:hypothetical protein
MKKSFIPMLVALALTLSLAVPQAAIAKGGKGKGKSAKVVKKKKAKVSQTRYTQSKTPPGWNRGKKTGWRGGKYPPGWSKWNDKKQIKWSTDRETAHTYITRTLVSYNIPSTTQNQIRNSFDDAILGGLLVNEARKKLISGLKDPTQRKLFMLNATKNVLDYLIVK